MEIYSTLILNTRTVSYIIVMRWEYAKPDYKTCQAGFSHFFEFRHICSGKTPSWYRSEIKSDFETASITMSSSERLKIFIRRNDIEAAELSPITSKPDRYELDMWEGDIPMPWEEFLTRIKGTYAQNPPVTLYSSYFSCCCFSLKKFQRDLTVTFYWENSLKKLFIYFFVLYRGKKWCILITSRRNGYFFDSRKKQEQTLFEDLRHGYECRKKRKSGNV